MSPDLCKQAIRPKFDFIGPFVDNLAQVSSSLGEIARYSFNLAEPIVVGKEIPWAKFQHAADFLYIDIQLLKDLQRLRFPWRLDLTNRLAYQVRHINQSLL